MALTACASGPPSEGEPGIDAPRFSGPYAAELTQAWKESDSEFVRDVIADEKVSDQEWAELSTRMAECLAKAGLEFGGFDDHGTYTVGPSRLTGDPLTRVLDGCETSTGELWVHALRLSMSTNPENVPIDELMTDCLIRNGAVSPDYTKEQFAQDNPAQTIPFIDGGSAVFWACNEDPLHSQKDQR